MQHISQSTPTPMATSFPECQDESLPIETKLFTKYVVRSEEELKQLHEEGLLEGAFAITGDSKHKGIHKAFHGAQTVCKVWERISSLFRTKTPLNSDLCHGMIIVGWDNTSEMKDRKTKETLYDNDGVTPLLNDRPILAHSVKTGVKTSAINYFTYPDKDVDFISVYVPIDPELQKEIKKNAESACTSSEKVKRSSFSWKNLSLAFFNRQKHGNSSKKMRKDLAYLVADLLMEKPISTKSDENQARSMFCMEFALSMVQASVLTKLFTPEEKSAFVEGKSREEVAKLIYNKLKKEDTEDSISKTYWETKIIRQIDPRYTLSSYGAAILDQVSEKKP